MWFAIEGGKGRDGRTLIDSRKQVQYVMALSLSTVPSTSFLSSLFSFFILFLFLFQLPSLFLSLLFYSFHISPVSFPLFLLPFPYFFHNSSPLTLLFTSFLFSPSSSLITFLPFSIFYLTFRLSSPFFSFPPFLSSPFLLPAPLSSFLPFLFLLPASFIFLSSFRLPLLLY